MLALIFIFFFLKECVISITRRLCAGIITSDKAHEKNAASFKDVVDTKFQ